MARLRVGERRLSTACIGRCSEWRPCVGVCTRSRRLREAATADPGDVEVQLLTAELFVERGWPTKAVKVLDRLPMAEAAEATGTAGSGPRGL